MDSASQSEIPPGEPPNPLSRLLGLFIAVLTLTLPLFVIDHFSSAKGISPTPLPYRFTENQR